MAKSKKSPVEVLEADIRKAIEDCPALKGMDEFEHFDTIDHALDLIQEGVSMRLQELGEEDDGGSE